MRLDKFKSVFKEALTGREEDYSVLERMIDYILELGKDSVSHLPYKGSKNLQKLVQELPDFYKEFKKAELAYNKLEGLKKDVTRYSQGIEDQRRSQELNPHCRLTVCMRSSPDDLVSKARPVAELLEESQEEEQKTEQKISRMEKDLVRGLAKVYFGSLDYSEKWLKREMRVLKKKLEGADDSFVLEFKQVEERLLPFDKLELYREMERCLGEDYASAKKNVDSYKVLLGKLGLAERAGVQVGELKERVRQGLGEKKQEIKRLFDKYW